MDRRESPPQVKYIPFCRLCTRAVWMYKILPDMRWKSRPSLNHQIIQKDLLSGILVVDTRSQVQNMAMNIFCYYAFRIFLLNICLIAHILRLSYEVGGKKKVSKGRRQKKKRVGIFQILYFDPPPPPPKVGISFYSISRRFSTF